MVSAMQLNGLFPISMVPDYLPCKREGRRYHASTAARWALYGLRGTKLTSVKLAGHRFTTREWLERFLDECATR